MDRPLPERPSNRPLPERRPLPARADQQSGDPLLDRSPAAARPRQDRPNRPDPRPMRLAIAASGLATASALAAAIMSPPALPASSVQVPIAGSTGDPGTAVITIQQPVPTPIVKHVKRYITLKPGQTPPPSALATQLPAPTPRVIVVQAPRQVVVTTRQSGRP
jgi:hypothetical protein